MSDKLLEVIEELQADESLGSLSEADISLGVVLRILDALSWNTYNLREVSPEYSVENRWVDYALLIGNTPQVFIEVKKGGEPLEKHQEQLLNYAFRQGVKIAILTNGVIWWFYLPLRGGSWKQRKFDAVELNNHSKEDITRNFLDFLSKENISSGNAVRNAEDLYERNEKKHRILVTLPEAWDQLVSEPDDLLVELLADKTNELCDHKPHENEVEQFLLTHLQNIKITKPPKPVPPKPIPPKPVPPKPKPAGSMKGTKPTAFTFNGTRYDDNVTSWTDMLVELCKIVHNEQGSRFEEVLGLKSAKRGKLLDLRREDDFQQAKEIKKTGIFVNTCKNADQFIQTAENLIAHFGYDKNALDIDAE